MKAKLLHDAERNPSEDGGRDCFGCRDRRRAVRQGRGRTEHHRSAGLRVTDDEGHGEVDTRDLKPLPNRIDPRDWSGELASQRATCERARSY